MTEKLRAYCDRLEAQSGYAFLFGFDVGPCYARVWKKTPRNEARSVVTFVGMEHGTLYRALSWKKRGARVGAL